MLLSHNDDPTLHDGFGNNGFVREICELIRNSTPPKGIGVNGYWGTGKTSILLQVCHQLTGTHPYGDKQPGLSAPESVDKAVMPVWFEAWRYQHEAQPIVALLNEIRLQMGMWATLQDKAAKLSGVAFLGALSAFDEVVKAASGGVYSSHNWAKCKPSATPGRRSGINNLFPVNLFGISFRKLSPRL